MDEAQLQERQKKTTWLMVAGAASLLLPLAGVLYMHFSENAPSSGPSDRSDIFERRESARIVPSQAVANIAPQGIPPKAGSSLDFIAGGADYKASAAAAAPQPSTAPAPTQAAAAPPAASPSPAPAPANAPKPFGAPKLQPSRGFANFKSGSGMGAASGQAAGAAAGGQNIQQVLQNLPPSAQNDPQIQKYLQGQGK